MAMPDSVAANTQTLLRSVPITGMDPHEILGTPKLKPEKRLRRGAADPESGARGRGATGYGDPLPTSSGNVQPPPEYLPRDLTLDRHTISSGWVKCLCAIHRAFSSTPAHLCGIWSASMRGWRLIQMKLSPFSSRTRIKQMYPFLARQWSTAGSQSLHIPHQKNSP